VVAVPGARAKALEQTALSVAAAARLPYWRSMRRITVALLLCWLGVTLALPWFALELDAFRLGRFPLGFWLTSQGAVGIYVVLIVVYIWSVEKLEDALLAAGAADPAGDLSAAERAARPALATRRGGD
jgi:putative solute:sodium symporter small subunit